MSRRDKGSRNVLGKTERPLKENGKRAGRSRESLQTPCESDHERRKKGKVVHWSKGSSASLQGCLGDLQPKLLIRGIPHAQEMSLVKHISRAQLFIGNDPYKVQLCNKPRDKLLLEHSSWQIVLPVVPDLRGTFTYITAQTQQHDLDSSWIYTWNTLQKLNMILSNKQ